MRRTGIGEIDIHTLCYVKLPTFDPAEAVARMVAAGARPFGASSVSRHRLPQKPFEVIRRV